MRPIDSTSLEKYLSHMRPGNILSDLSFNIVDEQGNSIVLKDSTILCRERHSTKKNPNKIKNPGYRFEVFNKRDPLGLGNFGIVYPIDVTLALNENGNIAILNQGIKQRVIKIIKEITKLHTSEVNEVSIALNVPYLHMKPIIESTSSNSKIVHYIIMHRMQGKTLTDVTRDGTIKSLNEKNKLLLLINFLEAVKSIHAIGISHNDIKNDNIMVNFKERDYQKPEVNIIDFGISQLTSSEDLLNASLRDLKDLNGILDVLRYNNLPGMFCSECGQYYSDSEISRFYHNAIFNEETVITLTLFIDQIKKIYSNLLEDKETAINIACLSCEEKLNPEKAIDPEDTRPNKITVQPHEPTQKTGPGLARLNTTNQAKALAIHLQNKQSYISHSISVEKTQINPLHYFVNQENKVLVLATPIDTANFSAYLDALKTHSGLKNISNYHLIIPLIGQGITERHIVTYYKAPGTESIPMIFDSKIGNLARFFNIKKNGELPKMSYSNLGTQSFFDPITCGYHVLANTANIASLIQEGKKVNTASLLKALKKNNLNSFAIPLLKRSDILLKTNYVVFIQQAWRDTFLTGLNQQERATITFKHYFLGWPTENAAWKRMLYTTLLGFLFYPLINTLKLLLEFPIQILKHSVDYIKNQLFLWTPTSAALQYLRTSLLLANYLLYGLSKGLSLIIHTSLSLIPTPCTLNTQQKVAINSDTSIKAEDTTHDYEIVGELAMLRYPETITPSNTSAFFKPVVTQAEKQRQAESIESSVSYQL